MSETKKWFLKTLEGEKVYFYPVFIVDSQNNIECQRVVIKIDENKYTFNFLDLLMFVYFIGDEEQRRKLTNIEMKTIREIPFNVTFKIDEREKKEGIAKRRIMLPVDNLIAAYCRDEAKKFTFKQKLRGKI